MSEAAEPAVADRPDALTWTTYQDCKPEGAGIFEWRVPSAVISGLTIILAARMRERGAGYSQVISPSFDYWDGYRVIVPSGIQWREADPSIKLGNYEERILGIEGLQLAPCIFCGKAPTICGWQRSGHGTIISPKPHHINAWKLQCCAWGESPTGSDPRELERVRREAYARAAQSQEVRP